MQYFYIKVKLVILENIYNKKIFNVFIYVLYILKFMHSLESCMYL